VKWESMGATQQILNVPRGDFSVTDKRHHCYPGRIPVSTIKTSVLCSVPWVLAVKAQTSGQTLSGAGSV